VLRLSRGNGSANLTAAEKVIFNSVWRFNYKPVDLQTGPQSEVNERYQLEAQAMVFRHVRDALFSTVKRPTGLIPTCADGFYGIYALEKGAEKVRIVDIGSQLPSHKPHFLEQTKLAAKMLGVQERCTFDVCDYTKIEGSYDFCILADCAIHFLDPTPLLVKMREVVTGPLVLFSTTIMQHKVPLLYRSPEPGRPWGSAFSHDQLLTFAVNAGWTVVNEQYKRLPDDWPGERNMSCFLCM